MKYFDSYTSNTVGASANQSYFNSDGSARTSRVFYKITAGGEYSYSFLFSNITDTTYSDGSHSHANLVCSEWNIHSVRVGKCGGGVFGTDFSDANRINGSVAGFCPATFGGCAEKHVAPGEFFASDPVKIELSAGDYLCLELTYSGTVMPYHEESLLPIFRKDESDWIYDRQMPLPGMVGCDREVRERIVYLGDSITQGIGTAHNSYTHWNAVLAEKIGNGFSHWNLGVGFARASDSATGGAWLYKAKHCEIAVVCIGTNDLLQNLPEEQIRRDIKGTVELLLQSGVRVVLQTIPPFEYGERHIPIWQRLNEMIKTELADKVETVFDVGDAIGQPDAPYKPIYGGHPNAEGCRIWGEKLYTAMKEKGIV